MKTKTLLALVLAAILLLGVFPAFAAESSKPTFTVDTVNAKPGDTVDVAIRVKNNPGITSLKLTVTYGDAITLETVTFNPDIGGMHMTSPTLASPAILNWFDGLKDVTGDWTYATLSFKVKSDAKAGSCPIEITYNPNDVFNITETNVDFAVENGGVNVTIPVTGVELTPKTASLHPGKTTQLTAKVQPDNATDKTVSYSSSDQQVATVNGDGLVTAVAPGTATITVTTKDGSKTATSQVTVSAHSFTGAWKTDDQNHWHECSCGEVGDKAAHTFKWVTDKEPTEEEEGLKHEECSVCGLKRSEKTPIDKLTHEMTHHPEVKATCVAKGSKEYWSCSNCGKTFADQDGKTELKDVTTPVDPTNHTGKTEVKGKKDATCTEDGYTGDIHCADCGAKLEDGKTDPATGHKLEKVEAKDPTHDAPGNSEHYVCANCGKLFADDKGEKELKTEDVTIPQIPHEFGEEWKSDEKAHWHACSCGAKDSEAAHTYGEWKVTKEATEKEAGSRERVCSVCGCIEKEEIPAVTTPAAQAPTTPSENPNTGDTQVFFALALLLVSGLGMAAAAAGMKNKRFF